MFATVTDELPVTAAEIAEGTKTDSLFVKIYEYTSSGWPGNFLSPELRPIGIVEMSFHWKMDACCGKGVLSYHLDSKNVY